MNRILNGVHTFLWLRGIDVGEIARFLVVGGLNTLLAFGVYALAVALGSPYYFALVFDYLFAIMFSLVVNGVFTFKTGDRIGIRTLVRMVFSYLVLFAVNEGLLSVVVEKLRVGPYVAQAAATVVIAALSYLLQRNLVFRVTTGSRRP